MNKKIYGGPFGMQNPKVDISLYDTKDAVNLKLYGTTDVYTLTEKDVWIEKNQITGQKNDGIISHDIIIIPEGVTQIVNYPKLDDDGGIASFGLNLKAEKIILPSTLTDIIMDCDFGDVVYSLDGELVLNNNIATIAPHDVDAFDHFVKKIVVNSSLQNLDFYDAYDYMGERCMEIIIPKEINSRLNINFGYRFGANLYVYNPFFDFSNVHSMDHDEPIGTIYGYVGSTAEAFAEEHGYTFIIIGSDYSAELGDIESAVDHILELDNSLLGGGAL